MVLEDLKGLYIAHRGIQNDDTIENTIPAFSLAISKKIPIEFDIHILKDGKLVVFHDDTLKRLMGIDKRIEDYTYEELKKNNIFKYEYTYSSFRRSIKYSRWKSFISNRN